MSVNWELSCQISNEKKWWEDKNHPSILIENFPKAGFYEVETPQYGDMLICRIPRTEHPNHCVIWLGDNGRFTSEETEPCIGNTLILHQLHGKNLSVKFWAAMV